VDRSTNPRVRGARVRVIATEVTEGPHDAEHEEAAVQQRGRTTVGDGDEQRSGRRTDRIGRGRTSDSMITESKSPRTPAFNRFGDEAPSLCAATSVMPTSFS